MESHSALLTQKDDPVWPKITQNGTSSFSRYFFYQNKTIRHDWKCVWYYKRYCTLI